MAQILNECQRAVALCCWERYRNGWDIYQIAANLNIHHSAVRKLVYFSAVLATTKN